jgi:hypothetical protein
MNEGHGGDDRAWNTCYETIYTVNEKKPNLTMKMNQLRGKGECGLGQGGHAYINEMDLTQNRQQRASTVIL